MTHPQETLEAVEAFATAWGVPGGVVSVGGGGGATTTWAFGLADVDRRRPVTVEHLFEVGSIGKVATALAVLSLVDEGALTLDTTVADVLPWTPPALRAPEVTLRRLLQHTAGLPSSIDAVQDDVAQLAAAAAPVSRPGSFHYSNVGYLLLGRVIATVTGGTYADALDRRVLGPAGMASSTPAVTHDVRDRLATGYRPRRPDRPWVPGDPLEPAPFLEVAGADGSIAATGADAAALAAVLVRRGAGVVSEEAFTSMVEQTGPGGEPVVEIAGVPPSEVSRYGLGVNVERVGGRVVLTHGGGMVGYASFLLADLDTGRTVSVLTSANGDGPVAEAIARAVAAGASSALDRLRPGRWARPGTPGLPRAAGPELVGDHGELQVHAESLHDGVALTAHLDGVTAPLLWTWSDRVTSTHPSLRRFGLSRDGGRWVSGDRTFAAGPSSATGGDPSLEPFCGRFRSYSPWLPEFTIVQREGELRLLAADAVESPGDDVSVTRLSDRSFAIGGRDVPDRLYFGPLVDGEHAWVDKNGCRYSRAFRT